MRKLNEFDVTGHLSVDYLIEQWANDRGLILNSNPQAQFVKLIEEAGELANAIAKKKPIEEVADALGDMFVVMTIIAAQYGLNINECCEGAYDTIKDRKGYMTKDGIFIKEE